MLEEKEKQNPAVVDPASQWLEGLGRLGSGDGQRLTFLEPVGECAYLKFTGQGVDSWIEVRRNSPELSEPSPSGLTFRLFNRETGETLHAFGSIENVLMRLKRCDPGPPPAVMFSAQAENRAGFSPWQGRGGSKAGDTFQLALDSECGRRCLLCRNHYAETLSPIRGKIGDAVRMVGRWRVKLLCGTLAAADRANLKAAAGRHRRLLVHGADATLNPELPSLVAYAKTVGFTDVAIQAPGGGLIDRARVAELKRAGVNEIFLPLYSFNPARHDYIVGLNGALAQLERLMVDLQSEGLAFQLNLPLLRENLDDFLATGEECDRRGLRLSISLWFPEPGYERHYVAAAPAISEIAVRLRDLPDSATPFIEYLPLCAYPASVRERIAAAGARTEAEDHGLAKPAICGDCRFYQACTGLHPAYIKAFGTAELHPEPEVK